MSKDSQLRITTWPADQVPAPTVHRFPQAELHGDVLALGGRVEPVQVPDQVRLFELADADVDDAAALVDVVREVGGVAPYDLTSDLDGDGAGKVEQHAILHGRHFDRGRHRDGAVMRDVQRVDGPYVHLDEVAYRLALLRALTDHAATAARGLPVRDVQWPPEAPPRLRGEVGDWRHFSQIANAALSPFRVRVLVAVGDEDVTLLDPPGLFSVAVLQLVNDMTANLDYHVCTAERCGRLFVRQRGRSVHYSRTTGSIYCSKSCMNAQTQRNYRRRQRVAQKAGQR